MPNPRKFHLVFSVVMGGMMIICMSFVVTWVNLGFVPNFLTSWAKSFVVAYAIGVPLIFFLAPLARRIAGRIVGMEP